MASSRSHSPFAGAVWMLAAGLCFAAVNSLSQYVSFDLDLPSTQVAFHQYLIALVCLLPWLIRHGVRQSLATQQLRLHLLRVALAVIGIQFWLWALAVPVPIWQGIALLMTSPLFATLGSVLLLNEQVSRARLMATLAGFVGAMVILAPWTDEFSWASLLPVAAALFWAGYSLLVRYQAATESAHTLVVYLLIVSTPFNAMLAFPQWQWPSETQWLLVAGAGVLSALAQLAIARAYSVAEASFIQPFDFAKLPMNVLAGWLIFGWAPPGRLWLGAAIIIGAITLLTHLEQRACHPVS
ncbi:DMT family transporter [Aeromonas cavernicola]|nr:DMT family transporter [Aeromonas cavernicola]